MTDRVTVRVGGNLVPVRVGESTYFAQQAASRAAEHEAGAEAWAQSSTAPDPEDPTSKSAKSWAAEAEATAAELDGAMATIARIVITGNNEVAIEFGDGQKIVLADAAGKSTLSLSDRTMSDIISKIALLNSVLVTGDNEIILKFGDGQKIVLADADGKSTLSLSDRTIASLKAKLDTGSASGGAPDQFTNIISPWILLQFYGQSLGGGWGAVGLLSGETPYPNVYMPNHGVKDATVSGGNLVGYESLSTSLVLLDATVNSQNVEAPCIAAANQVAFMMGNQANIIAADACRGGFGVSGLVKGYNDGGGKGPYDLLVDEHQTYQGIIGDRPLRSILFPWQGEADANSAGTTESSFMTPWLGINANYGTDTGQPLPHMVPYQLSSHTMRSPGYNPNPGLAWLKMAEEYDHVSLSHPMYFLDYQPLPDGVHLLPASSRLGGCFSGKAAVHYLRTGEKFQPLRPVLLERDNKIITIELFVPAGNAVVDTENVSDPGDLGFEIFDKVTGALLPIDDLYTLGNRLRIVLASLPSNPTVTAYALGSTLNGQPAGRFTGARGCIRDQDDTRAYFDTSVRLYNRLVMFKKDEGYGA